MSFSAFPSVLQFGEDSSPQRSKALIAVAFYGTADLSRRAVEAVPFVESFPQPFSPAPT